MLWLPWLPWPAWASNGTVLVWVGINGDGGLFCMSPGRKKSNGEMDLLALMPLQPAITMAIIANPDAQKPDVLTHFMFSLVCENATHHAGQGGQNHDQELVSSMSYLPG
jgi:hypothetical protein